MLKFAVIGIGRMGFRHAYNLHMHFIPGAKLVAVADIDEKAQVKAKKLGVKVYADYKQMIDEMDIDAVVIATPHYQHVEIAKYCVEKGIHTLVEKPISVTTKAAKELIDLSIKSPFLHLNG